MNCKHCGAEIIRIDTWSGKVVCWAKPTTYWTPKDGAAARELLTPNGERVYGSLIGKLDDAVGIGYLPHICHQMPVIYLGRDSWGRPVYGDMNERLLVDIDPREGTAPSLHTKSNNEFDGEPNDPVEGDFDFFPCRDTW